MQYEMMFIVSADLEDPERDKKIAEVKSIIAKHGGNIVHETMWGKRKLVYPIRKEKHGVFVILNFETAPEEIKPLHDSLKFTEHVLRFMVLQQAYVEEVVQAATPAESRDTRVVESQDEVAPVQTEQRMGKITEDAEAASDSTTEGAVATKEKPVAKKKSSESRKKDDAVSLEDLDKKLDDILTDDMDV
jgi:small subunit ribosomal protein S6